MRSRTEACSSHQWTDQKKRPQLGCRRSVVQILVRKREYMKARLLWLTATAVVLEHPCGSGNASGPVMLASRRLAHTLAMRKSAFGRCRTCHAMAAAITRSSCLPGCASVPPRSVTM
jgi:hypothetical protein